MSHLKRLSRSQWYWIFGIAALVMPLTLMLNLYNKYLPVQEGWFSYYAFLMNKKGLLPYKDFYLFLQPLWPLLIKWIASFSDRYMYLHYWGIIERSTLIVAVYYLLSRDFSPVASFVGVVAATAIYQSINVDILYSFYQTTLLIFVLALILLQENYRSPKKIYFIGIGFLTALAFFTKQSSGLFIFVFFLFIMFWDVPIKRFLSRLLYFAIGAAIPSIAILSWLIRNNIFSAYLQQVFVGSSAKGSIFAMLFGFWSHNNAPAILIFYGLCTLLLLLAIKKGYLKIWIERDESEDLQFNIVILIELIVALLLAFLVISVATTATVRSLAEAGVLYTMFAAYLPFFILVPVAALIGYRWLFKQALPFSKSIAVTALAGFVWMYVSGVSYQIDEICVLLSASVVTAYFLDFVQFNTHFPKLVVQALLLALVFFASLRKLELPYAWWGWAEFHHEENATSVIPALQGFQLDPEDVKIYDRVYQDIMENTAPTDPIYTYPHIVLFNFVTGRLQPTFSPVHWFDVCSDSQAMADAERLKATPPKMIIFLSVSEGNYEFHEAAFRNGQKSGQREIEIAIHELVAKYDYRIIDRFMTPGTQLFSPWELTVYLKP